MPSRQLHCILRCETKRRLSSLLKTSQALALASVALLMNGPLYSQSQGTRVPIVPGVPTSPGTIIPADIHSESSSFIYLEELPTEYSSDPSQLVGWTFDWDPDTGTFIPVKQAFSIQLDDETGPPDFHITYASSFSSNSRKLTKSSSYGIQGSYGLVKVAASLANSSETFTGTLSNSLELAAMAEYPPAFVNFATLPESAFVPEALAVLNVPNAQVRATQWINRNYGRYVAIGVQLRGGVIARFTMNQTNSYEQRQSFFDFNGEYSTISVSAQIGQAAYEALSTGSLGLTMDAIGLAQPPPLPLLTALDTTDKQLIWANSLVQLAGTAKGKRGVFLMPVSVLENGPSFGPSFDLPEWDGGAIDLVAIEAYAALQTLAEACRWNKPTRLNLFLQSREQPISAVTYAQALYIAQDGVVMALQDLKNKFEAYMEGMNSSDPVFLANLLDSKNILRQRALELASASQSIRTMLSDLPSIEISAIDPGYSPEPADRYVRIPFRIEVRNIGYFDDDLVGPVVAWLEKCNGADDAASTFMMFEDNLDPGDPGPNNPLNGCDSHFGQQDLNVSSIDFLQEISGGAGDGLSNLRFNCEVMVHNMSQVVDLQFIDQTNRIGLLTYPLTNDGPFP